MERMFARLEWSVSECTGWETKQMNANVDYVNTSLPTSSRATAAWQHVSKCWLFERYLYWYWVLVSACI